MKVFQTPEFYGVWMSFDGDRIAFRAAVEKYLQTAFQDAEGKLLVDDQGPHWKSKRRVELSYAHTDRWGILIYSTTHLLGVDVESKSREFKGGPLKLAERFFPASESAMLAELPDAEQKQEFLRLWVQKEAYAKITRLGLANTLEQGVNAFLGFRYQALPITPEGFLGCVCVRVIFAGSLGL